MGNFNGKETEYTLHFAKGNDSDYYFLNSYDAKMGDHKINIKIRSIKVGNENGEKVNPNITAKEFFNILGWSLRLQDPYQQGEPAIAFSSKHVYSRI